MIEQLRAAWTRLRARKWLSLAFDAGVLLVAFFAIHAWQTRDLPVDELAPATQLAVLGEAGSPADSQAAVVNGQAGIVYFFAPWCGVCRASIGNLDGLVARGQVAWGTVVALDYADAAEVRDFIDRTGVSLPVLLGDAQTAADWSVRAFPTYYVIDASGRIDSRSVGYSSWIGMWVRGWLAR
jgi:thiol-disulfide isomerase/thioredoxin